MNDMAASPASTTTDLAGPRVLFLVEGFTDIRFVAGLAEVCRLTVLTPATAFASSGLGRRMREAGLSIPVYEIRGGRIAYQFKSLLWLWRRADGFDVVVCQELMRGALNANLVGQFKGLPVVASVLAPVVEYFRCKRERRKIGWAQAAAAEAVFWTLMTVNGRMTTRCLALGPYLLDCARRRCPHAELGHYYGIDMHRFRPANEAERHVLRKGLDLPPGVVKGARKLRRVAVQKCGA
jgi:hypothetical protein